jgi:Carboxypeptidase regulatory-like domain
MTVRSAPFGTWIVGVFMFLPASTSANTCFDVPPLKPIRHVCGIVTNQVGERIPNTKLILLKGGTELVTIQAGPDGKFEFGRVEAGNYELRAQFDGYLTVQSSIVVVRPTAKCNRGLNVTLPVTACAGGIAKAEH